MNLDGIERRPVDRVVPGRREAISTRRCVSCGHSLANFRDRISAVEAGLSGLCQCCQDSVFDQPDEYDDDLDD